MWWYRLGTYNVRRESLSVASTWRKNWELLLRRNCLRGLRKPKYIVHFIWMDENNCLIQLEHPVKPYNYLCERFDRANHVAS